MAFAELKYFSKALEKATATDLILPENQVSGPFSVLYLLHGLSDDHTIWQRRTSIERYVQDLPLIVVMPDSGRGFYCDAKQGMAWETAIVRDLVDYVDAMFHTRRSASGRCVAGLSMGGYGALKFALKYPDKFCAAVSHSGAVAFAHRNMDPRSENPRGAEFARIVGENSAGGPDDLYALVASTSAKNRPAIRIDCGTEDFLIEDNRQFHSFLNQAGYTHEYAEHPGGHDWSYWDLHIQDSLRFLATSLKIA